MIFDYIIVGAGSSGCVLADRLTRDGRAQVLLIESGGRDWSPLIQMPRGFGKTLSDRNLTWLYQVPKTGGCNGTEYWLRGKVMGGSSSLNGMVYVRGQPSDFNAWEEMGCKGWGWHDMSQAFLAIEDHEFGPTPTRGVGGPLKVSGHPDKHPLLEAMMDAAESLGMPKVQDINELDAPGIGYQPRTIFRGRRQSAAKAFLKPALSRQNLTVMRGTDVLRVLFEGRRAIGVVVRKGQGQDQQIHANEVILAAGALNSPLILQRSGIGDPKLLARHGIPLVAASPDVGENMREHRLLTAQFRVRKDSLNHEFSGLNVVKNAAKWALAGRGPLANAAFEVGGFLRTGHDGARPDAELGMGPISVDRSKPVMAMEDTPGAMCGGFVMRPTSRGHIRISAADPLAAPEISPNYLETEYDKGISVALFRFIRAMFAQPALAPWVMQETMPGPAIESDDEIVAAFHSIGRTGFHAACTCRMGDDADAVVDTHLRVNGVEGLRVCDISVMPTLVSGNTNAPAMAMAWRAADLILADRASGATPMRAHG